MTTSRSRTALVVFFLVAFGIPWAGAIVAKLKHVNDPQISPAFIIAMAFCSVAGVLATYVETGRQGLKDLARRCLIYRVPLAWWIYALFLPFGIHLVATFIYAAALQHLGPFKPANLLNQWWMLYIWAFGLLQGPLGEELGWRGYLLPRLLRQHDPLNASILVGFVWAAWHFDIFFHSFAADALFFASAIALSILMTVLFLHTRGSVLLAVTMHAAGNPGRDIAQALFPTAAPVPDWLRAVVLIATAAIVVAVTRGRLSSSSRFWGQPPHPALSEVERLSTERSSTAGN
jgi:uncharacterized protein